MRPTDGSSRIIALKMSVGQIAYIKYSSEIN